jgi:DNA polymerase-3 subunit delta
VGASLRFAQLQQALVRGQIDPVYLFEGPESFFHEEGIRLLERAALPPDAGGINRHVVDGREADLQELLDLAATYPMGAGRRLILVRRASGLKAESVDPLKAYLERPSASTCLIFSDTEFDARRSVYKALAAAATRVDCAPLRDVAQVAAWVRDRLKARSFGLSPELAEAIAVGLSGAGLARIDSEMEKLMAAIGAPRPVEPGDLGILADVPRVGSAFQVALLALRGDRGPALRSVRDLLQSGEEPPMMLGAIAWYLRAALKARAASDRRVPPRDLQALYGLNPGRVDQIRGEIGKVSALQLRRALRLCLRADREIKGGGAKNPAHAFERLVHGIARSAAGSS